MTQSLDDIPREDDYHAEGLIRLLQLPGMPNPSTEVDISVLNSVRARLQTLELAYDGAWKKNEDDFSADEVRMMPSLFSLLPLISMILSYCRTVVRKLEQNSNSDPASTERVRQLFAKGVSFNQELTIWEHKLPEVDQPGFIILAEKAGESTPAFHYICHTFKDIKDGARWLVYWSSRIRLLQSLMKCSEHLENTRAGDSNHEQHAIGLVNLRAAILELVDNVLCCKAFLLGQITSDGTPSSEGKAKGLGAYFLLCGLKAVIAVLEFTSYEQRQWLTDALKQIGHVYGVKSALVTLAKHPELSDVAGKKGAVQRA